MSRIISKLPSIEMKEGTGPSLELARECLGTLLASDQELVCENVVSEAGLLSLEGVAETVEAAYAQCEERVPAGALVTERRIVSQPFWSELVVAARDEQTALQLANSQITATAEVKSVQVTERGRNSAFGVGQPCNHYAFRVWQPAVVSISVERQARVSWTVQRKVAADEVEYSGLAKWLANCALSVSEVLRKANGSLRPYLPGQPKFICAQDKCTHSCCLLPSSRLVFVTKSFADVVKGQCSLDEREFVDTRTGFPVLKTREENKCVFVDDCNRCRIHAIKPHQCASYPFDMAFFSLKHDGILVMEIRAFGRVRTNCSSNAG